MSQCHCTSSPGLSQRAQASARSRPSERRFKNAPSLLSKLGNQQSAHVMMQLARPRIQTKLAIGPAGDEYEREADRVAAAVVAMPAARSLHEVGLSRSEAPRVRRRCAQCEEEDRLRRAPTNNPVVVPGYEPLVQRAHTGGRPLRPSERAYFEPRFGTPLGGVRIFEGPHADRAARAVGALAYTFGSGITFRSGAYNETSQAGRRLMAHELTHVLQQNREVEKRLPETSNKLVQVKQASHSQDVVRRSVRLNDPPHLLSPTYEPPTSCGPDVTREVRAIWLQIRSDFQSWTTQQKHDSCIRLINPIIGSGRPLREWDTDAMLEGLEHAQESGNLVEGGQRILNAMGYDLNRDAFDTIGLYQPTVAYTRHPPVHPPCNVPGSPSQSPNNSDPAHEDPHVCSNAVQLSHGCWLSGTANYGTYGVMMRSCHDWAQTGPRGMASPTGLPAFLFSLRALTALVVAYKRSDRDGAALPLAWAQTNWRRPGTTNVSNPNRSHCDAVCQQRAPITFDYVWETAKPRSP